MKALWSENEAIDWSGVTKDWQPSRNGSLRVSFPNLVPACPETRALCSTGCRVASVFVISDWPRRLSAGKASHFGAADSSKPPMAERCAAWSMGVSCVGGRGATGG